jgi:predicted PurR-regulated permease PerM
MQLIAGSSASSPLEERPAEAQGQAARDVGESHARAAEFAQVVIAAGVVIALLRFAQPFFVPQFVGILSSYTLGPVVTALQRVRVPRSAGAAVVLCISVASILGVAYALSDDAARLADELPSTAKRLRQMMHEKLGGNSNALASMHKAAAELERAANEASGNKTVAPPATQGGAIAQFKAYLLTGTSSALAGIAELLVALLIAYFLLAAGDTFRRKLGRIAGPSLARRRVTLEVLDEVHDQVQRYMLILLVTNLLVGLAVWGLFAAAGMEGAGLWGVIAGFLHVIPYAGTVVLAGAAAVAGMIQLGSITGGLLLAGGTVAIATLIGIGLTTWLNSRAARINPVMLFGGLLFFGWLWGAWGLLLGPPLLAVMKAISERVESMQAFAELLRGA